jgi:hypothetical protein
VTDTLDPSRGALDGRLETVAWGLALLAFGLFLLIPGDQEDAFLASLGAILIGLNGARAAMGLALSWFTIVCGATALVAGLGSMVGLAVPGLGLLFIVIGGMIVVRAVALVRASEPARTMPRRS